MTTRWGAPFDRASAFDVSEDDVRAALARRRRPDDDGVEGPEGADEDGANAADDDGEDATDDDGADEGLPVTSDPVARVVADADVLAADLLVGGPAREALDVARAHSWVTLVASEPLLDDAVAVIADLADPSLAAVWRSAVVALAVVVDHPPGDHPAIAAALHGEARHVLSFDESLRSAAGGVAIRARVETSVKHPAAFARLFDPSSLYPVVVGGTYPGPDRDPRG